MRNFFLMMKWKKHYSAWLQLKVKNSQQESVPGGRESQKLLATLGFEDDTSALGRYHQAHTFVNEVLGSHFPIRTIEGQHVSLGTLVIQGFRILDGSGVTLKFDTKEDLENLRSRQKNRREMRKKAQNCRRRQYHLDRYDGLWASPAYP
jgi:hypothetical protein